MRAIRTASETHGARRAARWAIAFLLGALLATDNFAQTTVTTLGGGPNESNQSSASGNADGNTLQFAQFNTPGGILLDITGRYLFLADTANGAIRRLDLTAGDTATYLSGLGTPVDVAMDANTNLYVLTQGAGDGRIRQYDQFGQLIATNNATLLTSPTALAFDGSANIYVVELGGALKRVALSNGAVTTIVAAGTFSAPRGIEVLDSGTIAVSDTGNHVIRLVSPTTFAVTLLSGLVGTSGTNVGTAAQSRFSSPFHLAKAGGDVLVVADQANHRVLAVATNGATSVIYGIPSNSWVTVSAPGILPGWADGTAQFAEARSTAGVVVDGSGNIFVTEQFYHLVRRATGSGLAGASGVGSSGSGGSGVTLTPPSLTFSPNTGYFPLGTTVIVTSSSTNVYYTTDGTEPTTNSTRVTMASGTGVIQWQNSTNDLTGLRVASFLFSGTNSASTNITGVTATATTIGVPASLNTNIFAGVGARVVVPIVLNLRTNDTLRTLQFRVEVTPVGVAPMIGATFGAQATSTNDFVLLTTGGASAAFSSLAYTAGTTRGLVVSYIGTNANFTANRFAVAALLTIPIPAGAAQGDTYSIDILQPSGTSDAAQNTVALAAAGSRVLTVTNLSYRVGDTSPGGWYNAGDFGNGNLDNADVNNTFNAAAGIRLPFAFSDAFDAMDAFPEDTAGTVGGDGQIRFLDWQIILLRALRLNTNPALGVSTTNWLRTWSGGVRTTTTTNLLTPAALRPAALTPPGLVWHRQAAIGALPLEHVSPGAAVHVPVFARVAPGAALSGLQFRALVSPSAGAPGLAQPPQFIAFGLTPAVVAGQTNAVAAAWNVGQLAFSQLSSNLLGFVRFTVPASAVAGASYAVSFANADGAPDFATQYSFETRGATVWVGRAAPAPPSVIADEWKVHFFGDAANAGAADLADPDGDGVVNALEYFAGTDPTSAASRVQLAPGGWRNGGRDVAFQLLSAPGKLYVLECNPDLASPVWSPVVTNLGDGHLKEFIQTVTPGGPRYYRLRVLP
jgi:hypothetical protein